MDSLETKEEEEDSQVVDKTAMELYEQTYTSLTSRWGGG